MSAITFKKKNLKNKISGVLYGLALGDAMGMPSELWGKNKVKDFFKEITNFLDGPSENEAAKYYKAGQYTDDTSQALVILDALKETNFKPSAKIIGQKLYEWAKKENAFEKNILGPSSKVALKGIRDKKDVSYFTNKALSNGSAMRIAPIGTLFNPKNKEQIAQYVYEVSKVTHSSDVGIAGAAIIAVAVASSIYNDDFEQILKDVYQIEQIARVLGVETFRPCFSKRIKIGIKLAQKYKNNDKKFLNEVYDILGAGIDIVESVSSAITIAYYSQDPNKCALLCANLAGDTDTIGAMATAICGGLKGKSNIKESYINKLQQSNFKNLDEYAKLLINHREKLWKF